MSDPMSEYEQHLRVWAKADPERLMPYVERALRIAKIKQAEIS